MTEVEELKKCTARMIEITEDLRSCAKSLDCVAAALLSAIDKRTDQQKRNEVRTLIMRRGTATNRCIARAAGVSEHLVRKVRRELESNSAREATDPIRALRDEMIDHLEGCEEDWCFECGGVNGKNPELLSRLRASKENKE